MKKKISPFIIENLTEDSGFLMLQVLNLWENCHEKALKKYHNLSHMQYAVLASIYWLILQDKNQVTQIRLAQHTKIKPMTISQILRVLETKNYICRKTHSTDTRAKIVDLTQEGKELMNAAIKTVINADAKFFHILGKDITRFNTYMFKLLEAND